MPSPRRSRKRPTGVSACSGASSSTRLPSARRRATAATPWDSTRSSASTCAPNQRRYRSTAAPRSATATPRWWIPVALIAAHRDTMGRLRGASAPGGAADGTERTTHIEFLDKVKEKASEAIEQGKDVVHTQQLRLHLKKLESEEE